MSNHLKLEEFQLLLDGNTAEVGKALLHLDLCPECQLELSRQAAGELELTLVGQWVDEGELPVPVLFGGKGELSVASVTQSPPWSAMGGFLLVACCFLGLITWGVGNGVGTQSAVLAGTSCHQLNAWCR